MTVYFFDCEVKRARERFNQNFSSEIVFNINARYSAMLSICWLGILRDKIKEAEGEDEVKGSIQEFTRIRDVLNNFFNLIESQKERRCARRIKDSKQRSRCIRR